MKKNNQKAEITREELIATAKQLNNILAVNEKDAIKIGLKAKDEDIKAGIITLGEEIEASDFEANPDKPDFVPFDETAVKVFEALGVLVPKKPAAVKKDEKGKKAPKKEKVAPKPKYTRANAFADAFLFGTTDCDKLIAHADKFYVDNGGTSNLKEAKWYHNVMMPGLVALGIVSIADGKITILKDMRK